MQLRIDVDQAESFRRGVDCPTSVVSIKIDPALLSQPIRELIAKRMVGIDVQQLGPDGKPDTSGLANQRIRAHVPTLAGLIDAVERDEARIDPTFKPSGLESLQKRVDTAEFFQENVKPRPV